MKDGLEKKKSTLQEVAPDDLCYTKPVGPTPYFKIHPRQKDSVISPSPLTGIGCSGAMHFCKFLSRPDVVELLDLECWKHNDWVEKRYMIRKSPRRFMVARRRRPSIPEFSYSPENFGRIVINQNQSIMSQHFEQYPIPKSPIDALLCSIPSTHLRVATASLSMFAQNPSEPSVLLFAADSMI